MSDSDFCHARDGYGDECGRPVASGTLYCDSHLSWMLLTWQRTAAARRAELQVLEAQIQGAEEALEARAWTKKQER